MATTNTTTSVVENTFNLEDRPELACIFFVVLLLSHVYVAARVTALVALQRQLGLASSRLKVLVATFPVTFATILAVRTTTHGLNNACWELVPYSYLIRFAIHISLLVFQLRAFIVLRWFTSCGLPKHKHRRRRTLATAFVVLFTPAVVICVLMWALKLGIQLNGVCTVGRRDGTDKWLGVSGWVWSSQAYELVFIIANMCTEVYLGRTIISLNSKRELRMATRWSTLLLVWDTLFRFEVVQAFIKAVTVAGTSTQKGMLITYGITFACCYVAGMSCLFAFAFERARIKHFKLGVCCCNGNSPVRLCRMACRRDRFTPREMRAYKQLLAKMKQENDLTLAKYYPVGSNEGIFSPRVGRRAAEMTAAPSTTRQASRKKAAVKQSTTGEQGRGGHRKGSDGALTDVQVGVNPLNAMQV